MGWCVRCRALVALLCLFLSATLSAKGPELLRCADYISATRLPQSQFATIKLAHAPDAELIYFNEARIRAKMKHVASLTTKELKAYLKANYAFVTSYINDNKGIHHSGVTLDESNTMEGTVPPTYGRAFITEGKDGKSLVDIKSGGVTYVAKGEKGNLVLDPKKTKFEKTAHHQNGVGSLKESATEISDPLILNDLLGEGDEEADEANQILFAFDLKAKIYHYDDHGNLIGEDPAVMVGRDPNVRFVRLDSETALQSQKHFLHRNAKLFWKGLFHASLNRYNAEGARYIDYGTFTGVPQWAYRLTAMGYVPYGLSDFYGLFGEWSQGQTAHKSSAVTLFYPRSWGLFLANFAVALGMNEEKTYAFASKNHLLGDPDLHELLLALNENREAQFRSDPTKKTYSKMDLVEISESFTRGAERLRERLDTAEIYRQILRNAARPVAAAVSTYETLLQKAADAPVSGPLQTLAKKLSEVESLVRALGIPNETLVTVASALDNQRVGEAFLRERSQRDARDFQSAYQSELRPSVDNFVDKRRERLAALTGRPFKATSAAAIDREILAWAQSGHSTGYIGNVRAHQIDRDLPFITPTPSAVLDPKFQSIMDRTIGLIWRDTRPAGEQFGHSFIRIGKRIFDLEVARIQADDFQRVILNRFFYNFGMLGRAGSTPYYEVVYPVSESAKRDLLRYFEARSKGEATIAGEKVIPHFDVSGNGDKGWDGIIRENCGSFATSFNHDRWWSDYPGLKDAVASTGLKHRMNGATVALQSVFDPSAKPLAFVSWGGSYLRDNVNRQHEALGFSGAGHSVDILQTWGIKPSEVVNRAAADEMRDWALSHQLTGYQATALPAVSKSGALSGKPHRFNFIKLDPKAISSFSSDIASQSLTLWWRYEPGGQFGHLWVAVGNNLYDDQFGKIVKSDLSEFLKSEASGGFTFNGAPIFYIGLQVAMMPDDLARLKKFFDARALGKKQDGSAIPTPAYEWNQPFVRDQITGERCGMFSTSFGNTAWQALFPELNLNEVTERYGLRYLDGSLFIIHQYFHHAKTARNVFVIGSEAHVRKEGFDGWMIPTDPLPNEVKETSRGAMMIGPKETF